MILLDGPMAGREVNAPLGYTLVIPALESDGAHFSDHFYDRDGRWVKSQTYVGYESDDTIAERVASDEWMYWNDLEAGAERSYV